VTDLAGVSPLRHDHDGDPSAAVLLGRRVARLEREKATAMAERDAILSEILGLLDAERPHAEIAAYVDSQRGAF
jgi:hypothetical protein